MTRLTEGPPGLTAAALAGGPHPLAAMDPKRPRPPVRRPPARAAMASARTVLRAAVPGVMTAEVAGQAARTAAARAVAAAPRPRPRRAAPWPTPCAGPAWQAAAVPGTAAAQAAETLARTAPSRCGDEKTSWRSLRGICRHRGRFPADS